MVNILKMKRARLINGKIEEIKAGKVIRPSEAEKGYGWYNIIEAIDSLKPYERKIDTNIIYDSEADVVLKEIVIENIPLEEYKDMKYSRLSNNTKMNVLIKCPDYKQMSASMGIYSPEENKKIIDFVKSQVMEVRRIKPLIYNATSYEEIDLQPDIITLEKK